MLKATKDYQFNAIEDEINQILNEACQIMLATEDKVSYYSSLFDRSSETGFYSGKKGPRGEGEQPTWAPNPAYMDSLEELWVPVDEKLKKYGLTLEKPLRELFYQSHEYKDKKSDHRRVFHGQLVDMENRKPVTYFMINIPHSHTHFNYVRPPQIQIASGL